MTTYGEPRSEITKSRVDLFNTPDYNRILNIYTAMYQGSHESFGADCSGVQGACAHAVDHHCAEFQSCEAANRAITTLDSGEQSCPLFIDIDDGWERARTLYEKTKLWPYAQDVDNNNFHTVHVYIDTHGEPIEPDIILEKNNRHDSMYLKWYDPDRVKDALCIIHEYANTSSANGHEEWDDRSAFLIPTGKTYDTISDPQRTFLLQFCEKHSLVAS